MGFMVEVSFIVAIVVLATMAVAAGVALYFEYVFKEHPVSALLGLALVVAVLGVIVFKQ